MNKRQVLSQLLTYCLPNDISQKDLETQVGPLLEELTLKWEDGKFVTFCYEDSFLYPQESSKNLIGLCTQSIVLPDAYPLSSFRDHLNKLAPQKIVVKTTNQKRPNVDNIEVITDTYLDFSKLVSFLEKEGFVKTVVSKGLNCLDKRRFTIVKDCPSRYVGKEYHVDFLGTSLGEDLTSVIINLYKNIHD